MSSAFAASVPLRLATRSTAHARLARHSRGPHPASPATPPSARPDGRARTMTTTSSTPHPTMTGGGRHAQRTTASAAVADAATTAAQTAVDVGSAQKAPRAATTVLLYDGECPLCLREVAALRTRAAAFETAPLAFVDIAAPDYDPAENGGVTFEDAMGRIHAVMPNGEVVVGVDVFRRVYEALGLGWVYGWTKLPVLGTAASAVYDFWAANRLALTGRPTLAEIVALREKADKVERDNEDGDSCNEDGCSVDRRYM